MILDFLGLFGIVWDFLGFFWDFLRFFGIFGFFWDFLGFFGIFTDFRIFFGFFWIFRIFSDFFRIQIQKNPLVPPWYSHAFRCHKFLYGYIIISEKAIHRSWQYFFCPIIMYIYYFQVWWAIPLEIHLKLHQWWEKKVYKVICS